ncbi:MAG: twin-arginine translocation signal domain-containing protein, partial [Bryobacteraceae bacterium]
MESIQRRIENLSSRRNFLRRSAALTLATLAGERPNAVWGAAEKPVATADAVILLWMGGGMAQTETFDP